MPAEGPPPTPSFLPAPRCEGREYHRLDFWVGEWDVRDASGARDGSNVITKTLDGCALEEHWQDANGSRGTSLFFYDRAARAWKQVWATSNGAWKEKTEAGGAPAGAVRFEGRVPRAAGGEALDRTTLVSTADGHVEQSIEQSTDGGATWKKWTGIYERKAPAAACVAPEHRQLDFWLGDWDLVVRARKAPGADDWAEARGTNAVRRTHGGCVVEETFQADGPGAPWAGHSVSLFAGGQWHQTWVDDSGSYLTFTGGTKDGETVLASEPTTKNGQRAQMRMVFTKIQKDSLFWRWERSVDDGATWTPQMTIDYRRRGTRAPR